MTRATLILMAKAPEPGKVKTRMTRGDIALSASQAANLQAAFIRDALVRRPAAVEQRILWTRGDEHAAVWDEARAHGWAMATQRSIDLGVNLNAAFAHHFSRSNEPALVIGTDSPNVPDALLSRFVADLAPDEIAVGPSLDGGYYALALGGPHLRVFEDIAWGTRDVFRQTLAAARALKLRVRAMPSWYDVDEVADLRRLRVDSQGTTIGEPAPAAHTLAFVHTLGKLLDGDQV